MPVKDLESAAALSNDSEPVAVSPVNEWDLPVSIPAKPAHWDYGYVIHRQTFSSTGEALPKVLEERVAEINFVWTPETPRPVFPEYVPFLLETFRRLEVKEARKAVLVSAVLMVLGVLTTIGTGDQVGPLRNVLFVLGAVGLTEAIGRYRGSRNHSQDDAIRDASGSRFAGWLGNKNPSGYTVTLCAAYNVTRKGSRRRNC